MKKNIYCEDLNRHIPQNINEFASLALAGKVIFVVYVNRAWDPPVRLSWNLAMIENFDKPNIWCVNQVAMAILVTSSCK